MSTTREPQSAALVCAWLDAARGGAAAEALEAVYTRLAAEIARLGPTCWTSGKCCNFEAYGHRLYVTGLEVAYTVTRAFPPLAPSVSEPPPSAISLPMLQDARRRGGCPYQAEKLCGVHPVRPLGCRVYFCDPAAQGWQGGLSERALAQIRRIHQEFALPYRYGEWREMLDMFAAHEPRA